MKYYNTKTILAVLISIFVFLFTFIACKKEEHTCPVCPPTDYYGYVKIYDAFVVYPFLNPDYIRLYEFCRYNINDTTGIIDFYTRTEGPASRYYKSDDLSLTHYNGPMGIFYNVDSAFAMMAHPNVGMLVTVYFPLMFPQSKYFVGKKWDGSGSIGSPLYREIISINEVVTTEAGVFENCIKIIEPYSRNTIEHPEYVIYYVRNDIGCIKSERYRYSYLYNKYVIYEYRKLIDKNY